MGASDDAKTANVRTLAHRKTLNGQTPCFTSGNRNQRRGDGFLLNLHEELREMIHAIYRRASW